MRHFVEDAMSDIFISYKREDRPAAEILRERLKEQGFSVWWDRKIPAGRSFDEVIQEALEKASCVIVLWSKRSVHSDWVKEEAEKGASRGVLVPLLIDDVQPPLGFGRLQTGNIAGWEGESSHPGFVQLTRSIQMMLGGSVDESGLWQSAAGKVRPKKSPSTERRRGDRRASMIDRRSGDRRARQAGRRFPGGRRARAILWAFGVLVLGTIAAHYVRSAGGLDAVAGKASRTLADGYAWGSAMIRSLVEVDGNDFEASERTEKPEAAVDGLSSSAAESVDRDPADLEVEHAVDSPEVDAAGELAPPPEPPAPPDDEEKKVLPRGVG